MLKKDKIYKVSLLKEHGYNIKGICGTRAYMIRKKDSNSMGFDVAEKIRKNRMKIIGQIIPEVEYVSKNR